MRNLFEKFGKWFSNQIISFETYGIRRLPTKLIWQMEEKVSAPEYVLRLLNDDFTPMEYVVAMLQIKFRFERDDAIQKMLEVHETGCGEILAHDKYLLSQLADNINSEAFDKGIALRCDVIPIAESKWLSPVNLN